MRINEDQKFKYAEAVTVREYQMLVKALIEEKQIIKTQNDYLYIENSKY